MKYPTAIELSAILGVTVSQVRNGKPVLDSGDTLTKAQKRAVQPLLDYGVPKVIDNDAIDFEAGRRILALAPEYKQRNATALGVVLLNKLEMGTPLTTEDEQARTQIKTMWAVISGIRQASEVIKAMDPLPADYLALVKAFDAELAK